VKAEFLSAMHARVGVEIVAGHYAQLVRRVNAFVAFAGDSTPINAIDGNVLARYVEHLCNQVKKGHSTVYANVQLTSVKQFIRWAYKTEKLDKLPRELSSYSIEVKKSPVKTFTPEQVKGLLTSGITDRTKLFILLGLNCGMTQIDVSDLQQSEVNWTAGTITRKRSKTEKWETVPTVSYPLWADTFRLLINFRSNHKTLVLTTGSGKPMVTSELVAGREKKTDTIQKAWRQIKTSCKTLAYKHLRKTSATLLAGHRDFATVADLFLGHSPKTVSEIHYKKAPLELLADAVRWLGEVYGV
jgi:integrase